MGNVYHSDVDPSLVTHRPCRATLTPFHPPSSPTLPLLTCFAAGKSEGFESENEVIGAWVGGSDGLE